MRPAVEFRVANGVADCTRLAVPHSIKRQRIEELSEPVPPTRARARGRRPISTQKCVLTPSGRGWEHRAAPSPLGDSSKATSRSSRREIRERYGRSHNFEVMALRIRQDAEFASSQRSQKEYSFTHAPAGAGSHSGKRLAPSSAAKADGTYCSHDHLRGAVRALPSKECRLIEQLFWQERTETEVGRGDGHQSIHHQSPQARYSEGSPDEVARPERISKIFCIKILFPAI